MVEHFSVFIYLIFRVTDKFSALDCEMSSQIDDESETDGASTFNHSIHQME